jgi:ABC-2 type transport system permease protein
VKWSVLALEGAIWRGFSFGEILPSLLVLVGVGAVCFAVGTLVLQRRLAAA